MTIGPMPSRPSKGQKGQNVVVNANLFPITKFAEIAIHQYDITFKDESGKEILPNIENARKIWRRAEETLPYIIVYDGRKLAFSKKKLSYEEIPVKYLPNEEMEISEEQRRSSGGQRGGRGGRGGGRGGRGGSNYFTPPNMVMKQLAAIKPTDDVRTAKICIKHAAEIDMRDVLKFIRGQAEKSEVALQGINALSAYIRQMPSNVFYPFKSNFFTPEGNVSIGQGLDIWKGYHQSIRAMLAGHLGINVDVASAAFITGGVSVKDYVRGCSGTRIEDASRRVLHELLVGVQVKTTHRGDKMERFKIQDISTKNARTCEFTDRKSGRVYTVYDYFKSEYNYTIQYPELPLVKKNKTSAFPIEVLHIIAAQRFGKLLNPNQTADMIRATVQKPNDRERSIKDAVVQTFRYHDNKYLKDIGVEVSTDMAKVNARLLRAPDVTFSNNKRVSGQGGVWNLRDSKLVDTPALYSYAFVFFVQVSSSEASDITRTIVEKWKVAGMNIKNDDPPILVINPSIPGNVRGGLQKAFGESNEKMGQRCQLLVCIIEPVPNRTVVYQQIKRVTLGEAGVVSQCIQFKNVRTARDIKDQYICNVAMKANIKLGGATNYVSPAPAPKGKAVMFVGLDVTHAAPYSNAPSVAALVASTDDEATNYCTFVVAQQKRVEIILEVGTMFTKALDEYYAVNKKYPEEVFVFRDGVDNGQFKNVRDVEVQSIRDALDKKNSKAKLNFTVVQKRHHLRLFPTDRNKDRSENCNAGTVIDNEIVHPTEFNFILQSHSGIQGMSRPTIYTVLLNDSKLGADEFQELCFNLCFLSERATRSISVVAPSYRAHLAAFYARMFLTGEDISDTTSVSSGGTTGSSKITLTAVAKGIQNTMYYM
ncbi:Piwi domain-containing protein [Globomyces pollinis-pini]|nr:Piwi domain-containing protein [Globomyces pollinis-pini]